MKGAAITTGKSGLQCAFITPVIFTNYTVFPGIPFLKKGNIQSQKTLPAILDEPQGKKSPLAKHFWHSFTKNMESSGDSQVLGVDSGWKWYVGEAMKWENTVLYEVISRIWVLWSTSIFSREVYVYCFGPSVDHLAYEQCQLWKLGISRHTFCSQWWGWG